MSQKIPAKNSANVGIGYLQIPEVVNDNHRVDCSVRASFEDVHVREGRMRVKADADQPYRTFHPQVKFRGQRRVDDGDLSACIDQKVVWAGVVDLDWNNYLGAPNQTEA
jgi:hypothetical protein